MTRGGTIAGRNPGLGLARPLMGRFASPHVVLSPPSAAQPGFDGVMGAPGPPAGATPLTGPGGAGGDGDVYDPFAPEPRAQSTAMYGPGLDFGYPAGVSDGLPILQTLVAQNALLLQSLHAAH